MYECIIVIAIGKHTPFSIRDFHSRLIEIEDVTITGTNLTHIEFTGTKNECLTKRKEVNDVLHALEISAGRRVYKWFEFRVDGGTWKGRPKI